MRYPAFRTIWDRAVGKAKLDPPPTARHLLHACPSWLIAAGFPLMTVSHHLSHASGKLTANVCTDVDTSARKVAARAND
ncbi:hypothetical protein A5636_21800 [Mycobacterium asiaticum]|uniref:Uncharacterized protein n=1 Tax=Mycobacterium asiaticum TaxID=1790 RepID=A0A1A3NBU7_MYCAS|nr:hypothetical protein A5636_21800 [Mycobacterium asiaticum]